MNDLPIVPILSVIGLFLTTIIIIGLWISRYFKAGPNEALIVSGKGGQKVVIGGAIFVPPVLNKITWMSLEAQNVSVQQQNIYTKEQIPINVNAVLVYKIRGDTDSVLKAAQSLQGKDPQEIINLVQSVAEGSFRDICGKMTPEEINGDRESFQRRVSEVANAHFNSLGVELVTFTIQHISDNNHYFENLGMPRAVEVARDARQRKAEADRSATIVEVEQKRDSETRTAQTNAEVLSAQKERDIKKAQYDAEVAQEKAKSQMAGPRAEAEAKQEVMRQQTILAQREAERREKELEVELIRPAEAKKRSAIIDAEGQKSATVLNAEAQKSATILNAEAEAEQRKLTGSSEGEAARAVGYGEADAIKAKLIAEAEGLERKATAMKQFNDATMRLEIAKEMIRILPELATALTKPIGDIGDIRIIDFGGNGNGENSNSPINKILDISPKSLTVLDETLKNTVGMSLKDTIQLIRSGNINTEVTDIVKEE